MPAPTRRAEYFESSAAESERALKQALWNQEREREREKGRDLFLVLDILSSRGSRAEPPRRVAVRFEKYSMDVQSIFPQTSTLRQKSTRKKTKVAQKGSSSTILPSEQHTDGAPTQIK